MKSRNYESQNNEAGADDAVIQVSIEKSRNNELSHNNEVKGADGGPSSRNRTGHNNLTSDENQFPYFGTLTTTFGPQLETFAGEELLRGLETEEDELNAD